MRRTQAMAVVVGLLALAYSITPYTALGPPDMPAGVVSNVRWLGPTFLVGAGGTVSPKYTTSGFSMPPHPAQSTTANPSNSASSISTSPSGVTADTAAAIAQITTAQASGIPAQALAAASMAHLAASFAPDQQTGYRALIGCLRREHGPLDRTLRDHALDVAREAVQVGHFGAEQRGGRVEPEERERVHAPGGEVELRYEFTITAGLISRRVIAP